MPSRLSWLLLMPLAVNISADHVYSYGSQHRSEPGNLAEAESTPATREALPQDISCSGVKGQGPCFEMVSTGHSNNPSFQPVSYNAMSSSSGVASSGSRQDFGLPGVASSFNSIPSVSGSNLIQNFQSVVSSKNSKYDPNNPRIISYGPVYRLLKPHGASGSSRTMPSENHSVPITRLATTTSKSIPNGYKAGFSKISYNATQQGSTYNSVLATYSRRKPSLSNMIISSGPMITFIKPNQSNYQPVPTIDQAQSTSEPRVHIKPLVIVDQPSAETSKPFENGQEMNDPRPTSQPQVPNQSRYQSSLGVNNSVTAFKTHLASRKPSTSQLRSTDPKFTQLRNPFSSANTTYRPSSFFKPAQTTYMRQIFDPVPSTQKLADSSQNDPHDSRSIAFPLSGFGYRFTRPVYDYGASISKGTLAFVPSSSTKTGESNYNQALYQAGFSFPKALYGSPSPAVVLGDSRYGFMQSGKVYGSSDEVYTSNSQHTSSLSQNPYFIARQGRSSYSMFKPLQAVYKSFPMSTHKMPTKSFNHFFSENDSVQNSERMNQMKNQIFDVQAGNLEAFKSASVSAPVQKCYQGKHSQTPHFQPLASIQSHPYKPKNLFDYLSRLPFPTEQPVSRNSQQQTGQPGYPFLTNYNPLRAINSTFKGMESYGSSAPLLVSQRTAGLATPRSVFDSVNSGYVVDHVSGQSGVLVKPSPQFFQPLSS